MKLLTADIERQLRANALQTGDHVPVLKLFNPCGAATWLVTELDEDGDTMFALADLGFGCPELGSISLSELQRLRLPFGLTIERDRSFAGKAPLSVYAAAARHYGGIVENQQLLEQAAA